MLSVIKKFFAPAPHVKRIAERDIAKTYTRYRWSMLEATFIGYATFYIVRNNLSPVVKTMEGSLHYTDSMIGNILAISGISYGLGKFIMGALSDGSNPRKFMAFGMLLTAL